VFSFWESGGFKHFSSNKPIAAVFLVEVLLRREQDGPA
jgi:hypothetical protein